MKRLQLFSLAVLLVTASTAHADSISFSVGGHRVRVEAPRNCRSASCASISIPGVYESRRKRFDDDEPVVAASPPPPPPSVQQLAPPPAPAPAYVPPPQGAPQSKLIVTMVPAPMPLATYKPAAATTQEVTPPPESKATQPCPAPADKPADMRPAPLPPPPTTKVLHEDDSGDSPIGDWQTERKGLVRIVECGKALCGYTIKAGADEKGEAVLINMKPKTAAQWTGSVYSKDSGDTYFGTINLNGPNTLRVEACALGRFYCNDNHWTRIARPEHVISSREAAPRI